MSQAITKDAREKMLKTLQAFQEEMGNIRTSRAQAGLLDVVEVDAYGSKMKINQLGTVTVPDAHTLVIDLWDKSQLASVEKAIMQSPLGLTPQNDGKIIRIPFPPLTEERRKDLVKVASKHREEAKISIRNIRRHILETVKKDQKDGKIPEDDAHRLSAEIDKLTDEYVHKVEEAFHVKEADIMAV